MVTKSARNVDWQLLLFGLLAFLSAMIGSYALAAFIVALYVLVHWLRGLGLTTPRGYMAALERCTLCGRRHRRGAH